MVDEKRVREFAERYLEHVWSKGLDVHAHQKEEGYKFRFVDTFQRNFNLDAPDLAGMLEKAIENCNLVATGAGYLARPMLLRFAQESPEVTRTSLGKLFTEDEDVRTRIDEFWNTMNELVRKKNAQTGRKDKTFISARFISVLLAARFPEKYYAIKPSQWRRFAKLVDDQFSIPDGSSEGQKYHILAAYGDALREVLSSIPDVAKIRASMSTGLDFKDPNFNWMTQDAIFVTAWHDAQEAAAAKGGVVAELKKANMSGDEVPIAEPSETKTRTWAYAPGENAKHWEEFYRDGIISAGMRWGTSANIRTWTPRRRS
jgi:hypothetical protein